VYHRGNKGTCCLLILSRGVRGSLGSGYNVGGSYYNKRFLKLVNIDHAMGVILNNERVNVSEVIQLVAKCALVTIL
jgi:hypothetical protein